MQVVLLSNTKIDNLVNGSATSQHAAALLDVDFAAGEQKTKQWPSYHAESIAGWEDKPDSDLMKNLMPQRVSAVSSYNRAAFLPPKAKPKVWMMRRQ